MKEIQLLPKLSHSSPRAEFGREWKYTDQEKKHMRHPSGASKVHIMHFDFSILNAVSLV